MRLTLLRILPLAVVLLCLSGCGQDPGAPPQAVDLAVAAQLWNTPEKQWTQAELQRVLRVTDSPGLSGAAAQYQFTDGLTGFQRTVCIGDRLKRVTGNGGYMQFS